MVKKERNKSKEKKKKMDMKEVDPVNKNLDAMIDKYVENERMVRLDHQLQNTMVNMKEKFKILAGNATSAKAVQKRLEEKLNENRDGYTGP